MKCPRCGSTKVERNTIMLLMTDPPKVPHRCLECGEHWGVGKWPEFRLPEWVPVEDEDE